MPGCFTQKSKSNKKIFITNNPIWHIARSYLYPFQEIQTSQRQAVLINIDSPPEYIFGLDQAYIFKGRHLAIDKKYNRTNQQHGLYIAHYTEEYSNTIDNSSVKIHVYLDKHAKCSYVQAKKYCGSGHGDIINLPYEAAVIENSKDAANILNEFLNIRMNNYLEAIQQSNELEKKLCDTLIKLLKDEVNLDFYTQQAIEFIGIIKKINNYVDDYIDMRGKFVKKVLENLHTKMQRPPDELGKYSSEEEPEDTDNDIEIDFILPPHKLNDSSWHEEQKRQLIEKLTAKYKQFNSTKDLLKKQNALQDIKVYLLTLIFNEKLMPLLCKEEQTFVAEVEAKAYAENNNVDLLFENFTEKCFSGDVDTVEKIFEHVQGKIDFIFVYNLLKVGLYEKANSETSLNIIKVMDFIYEHSSTYRMVLPRLSDIVCGVQIFPDNKLYGNSTTFSKFKDIKTSNILFEKIHAKNIAEDEDVLFFPLFKAIYTDNMPLVKILLKHGMPASSGGIIIFKRNKDMLIYSTLKASLLLNCKMKFIELLHENNPFWFCDIPYTLTINNKLIPSVSSNNSFGEIILKEHCYRCPLILFLDNDNNLTDEAIEFFKNNFMSRVDFRDLMLAFAFLANTSYSNTTLTFRNSFNIESNQEKILLCKNKQAIIELLSNQQKTFRNIRIAYHTPKPQNTCKMVDILYKQLITMIDQQSIDEHLNIILFTELKLDDSNTKKLIDLRHANLNAGLLLLSFKDQLDNSDVINVVKIFTHISKLFANSDLIRSSAAKQKAELVLRTIKIEEPTISKTLQFSTFNTQQPTYAHHPALYTCDPPPGSTITNGRTIVPNLK